MSVYSVGAALVKTMTGGSGAAKEAIEQIGETMRAPGERAHEWRMSEAGRQERLETLYMGHEAQQRIRDHQGTELQRNARPLQQKAGRWMFVAYNTVSIVLGAIWFLKMMFQSGFKLPPGMTEFLPWWGAVGLGIAGFNALIAGMYTRQRTLEKIANAATNPPTAGNAAPIRKPAGHAAIELSTNTVAPAAAPVHVSPHSQHVDIDVYEPAAPRPAQAAAAQPPAELSAEPQPNTVPQGD